MSSDALPVLRGRRVLLRQPVSADIAARMEISRDPEEDLMYGGPGVARTFSRQDAEAVFRPYGEQDPKHERRFVLAALEWPDGSLTDAPHGRCIGRVRLHWISEQDRKARLAIGIFDRRFWSHGYGSEAMRLLFAYGLDTMNFHRVDLRVLAYNTRAIRAYEKCGFVREGVERESAFVNDVWHDDMMMSILDHEFAARQRVE
jgi:RimJ/RimL family protein N-acetyltransferase